MVPPGGEERHVRSKVVDPQGAATPFLKAGSYGTVRPCGDKAREETEEEDEDCRACTMPSFHADTHRCLERSAQQRGKVAHTARPGKPGNEECEEEDAQEAEHGDFAIVLLPAHREARADEEENKLQPLLDA